MRGLADDSSCCTAVALPSPADQGMLTFLFATCVPLRAADKPAQLRMADCMATRSGH